MFQRAAQDRQHILSDQQVLRLHAGTRDTSNTQPVQETPAVPPGRVRLHFHLRTRLPHKLSVVAG